MKYYVVDAFTDEVFRGTPAGVCLLTDSITDDKMQKIASENNLAETAFLEKKGNSYYLRWFTPDVEIDLCGHATLATAFVVMNFEEPDLQEISFQTKSGILTVTRKNDLYCMDFPSRMPVMTPTPPLLEKALGCKVLETYLSRDLVVVVKDEETLKNLNMNINLIQEISKDIAFAVTVTAKGDTCDFVSRFFAPNAGIIEDPVTGSSHSSLIPFWSKRLHKKHMIARQLSKRGGILICEEAGDRVHISGNAVCYLVGEIVV